MNKTLEVGNYNVNFCGTIEDKYNKAKYEMVMFEKFDGDSYIEDSKLVLYFLDSKGYVIPKLDTVKQVERFYKLYPNNSKIKCEHTIKATVII